MLSIIFAPGKTTILLCLFPSHPAKENVLIGLGLK
jgi:hypothetical protein